MIPTDAQSFEISQPVFSDLLSFLDQEIAAGLPASPRRRTQTALRTLLRVRDMCAENVEIDLGWYDRTFTFDG